MENLVNNQSETNITLSYAPPLFENTEFSFATTLDYTKYPKRSLTDIGIRERFIDRWGAVVRYCTTNKSWYIYNGKKWQLSDIELIKQIIKCLLSNIQNEYFQYPEISNIQWEKFISHTHSIYVTTTILEMLTQILTITDFNHDPTLINMQNGYYDLSTQQLYPHDPKKYFNAITNITYDKTAKCPIWIHIIKQLFNNNQKIIQYVQTALGYTLKKSANKRKMFFILGEEHNGTTIFLNTIQNILNDYGGDIDFSFVASHKKNKKKEIILSDLTEARFIKVKEANYGESLDETAIDDINEHKTQIRHPYQAPKEYHFTMWFEVHNRESLKKLSPELNKRMIIIQCNHTISENDIDTELQKKLKLEYSGIFNWILDGYQYYKTHNLYEPKHVIMQNYSFCNDYALFNTFINQCCIIDVGASTQASNIYTAYQEWSIYNHPGKPLYSAQKFGRLLASCFVRTKNVNLYYQGIKLKNKI